MKRDCQGGMQDVVVRFVPFLPKPPFRVFNLAGIFVSFSFFCLIRFLFFLSSFFLSSFFSFLLFFFLFFFFFFYQVYAKYFLTTSAFTGCGKFSPSIVASIMAPPENTFCTTKGPSYVGVHLPRGSPWGRMILLSTRSP